MKGRPSGPLPRLGGLIDKFASAFGVLEVAFFLEDSQQSADGGVGGRVRHFQSYFGCRGAAAGEDDVHDLSLATAQAFWFFSHPHAPSRRRHVRRSANILTFRQVAARSCAKILALS